MESIDKQIQDLQKEKMRLEREELSRKKQEMEEFGKTLKGRNFLKFRGANMIGEAWWNVIKVHDVRTAEKNNQPSLELHASGIHIHCHPAMLVKNTVFDDRWSDPDYNKSGGTDRHKTMTEGLGTSYDVRATLESNFLPKKHKNVQFNTARADEYPATMYSSWMEVEYADKDTFHKEYTELTEEQYQKYLDIAETVQNYVWSNIEGLYMGDYSKVWSSGTPLAITLSDKTRVQKYVDMLDKALDATGKRYNGDIFGAFLEFLEKKQNKK